MTHQPRVKCIVSTCTHYITDNICGAEKIDIWHQQGGQMAKTIQKTECKSFHKREGLLDMIGALHNSNFNGLASSVFQGEPLSPRVHCIVSTCSYWGKGDACLAEAIEITGNKADECEDTDCQTFRESPLGQRASSDPRI